MFSQIKYNAPLPGAEFRSRDLSIPSEAVKVLYEIDFQYGRDRELCLSILSSVFRGTPQVTQILQEVGRSFHGGGPTGAPWHHEAIVARNLRSAILDRKVLSVARKLKDLEKALWFSKGQEKQTEIEMGGERVEMVEEEGERGVARDLGREDFSTPGTTSSSSTPTSRARGPTPSPSPQGSARDRNLYARGVSRDLESQVEAAEAEFAEYTPGMLLPTYKFPFSFPARKNIALFEKMFGVPLGALQGSGCGMT